RRRVSEKGVIKGTSQELTQQLTVCVSAKGPTERLWSTLSAAFILRNAIIRAISKTKMRLASRAGQPFRSTDFEGLKRLILSTFLRIRKITQATITPRASSSKKLMTTG